VPQAEETGDDHGIRAVHEEDSAAMFLEEMEEVVPWGRLCALIEQHYPQPGKRQRTDSPAA